MFHIVNIINMLHHFKGFPQIPSGTFPANAICKPHKGKSFDCVRLLGKHFIASGGFIQLRAAAVLAAIGIDIPLIIRNDDLLTHPVLCVRIYHTLYIHHHFVEICI